MTLSRLPYQYLTWRYERTGDRNSPLVSSHGHMIKLVPMPVDDVGTLQPRYRAIWPSGRIMHCVKREDALRVINDNPHDEAR